MILRHTLTSQSKRSLLLRSLFSIALIASVFTNSGVTFAQGDTAHAPVVTQQPAPPVGHAGQEVAGQGPLPAQKLAPTNEPGGEANLTLPDLSNETVKVEFLGMS